MPSLSSLSSLRCKGWTHGISVFQDAEMILCDFENLTSNRFWMVFDVWGMVQKVGYQWIHKSDSSSLNGGEWQGGWGTKTHHADEFRTCRLLPA